MAYADIADMTSDPDLFARLTACAAEQGETDPTAWVIKNLWNLCASPDWAGAYASALAASRPRPGRDPSVITDAQILAAVQARRKTV